jgi:chemotaxis response regulator CheB
MVHRNAIRVLVANRPLVMREAIVAVVSEQPDIEVVGEVPEEANLAESVERLRPDVLVIALEERKGLADQIGFFLGRYPEMRIIAVGPEQNVSRMYWAVVDIRNKPVEHSEDGVLSAMREHLRFSSQRPPLAEEMPS